jgi:hypothetical protein
MRHADYRTTLRHYTVLGLDDTARAIKRLPTIKPDERQAATGTCDAHAGDCGRGDPRKDPQLYPQQLGRESVRTSAALRNGESVGAQFGDKRKPLSLADKRNVVQACAMGRGTAGEGARTLNIQLGRLMLCQLSYARGFAVYFSSVSRGPTMPLPRPAGLSRAVPK